MYQRTHLVIVFLLILSMMGPHVYATPSQGPISWEVLPSIPDANGFNGSFTGVHNGALIVIGGANFPESPVHEGGPKRYHKRAFVMTQKGNRLQWSIAAPFEQPVAYGASVTTADGLLCLGGTNGQEDSQKVIMVTWTGSTLTYESFPDLPYAMKDMAAARLGKTVYVAAGYADGQLSNRLLALDLSQKGSKDFGWTEKASFPGPGRAMPVMVAQQAEYGPHLFLIGGTGFDDTMKEPAMNSNGWEYDPASDRWTTLAEATIDGKSFSFHGAMGLAIGAHHILLGGGVNRENFRSALLLDRALQQAAHQRQVDRLLREKNEFFRQDPNWYQFNREMVLYHTISDTWTVVDQYPYQPLTVGGMVPWEEGWIIAGGEIKPGVRTNEVYYGQHVREPRFGSINWLVLGLYLLGMLILGYRFMRQAASTDDFYRGGGRIPWWAAGISIFATMLSAITFMAIPAFTYASDWKRFMMAFTILIMALPVVRYYLPFFRRLNVTTAYEYLEARFSYTARLLASTIFILFMVARMAIVLFLPSLALTTVTGIDIYVCILLMGLITIIYCTMGGVEAVIWGDVIQGVVLLGGAIVSLVFLIGGTEGGLSKMIEISIAHDKLETFDFTLSLTSATFWVVLFGGLANNLISYSSDQAVIQRYMTTTSEAASRKSILFNGVMSVVVSLLFYLIGTAMFSFYKTHPDRLDFSMSSTDAIFPHFIMTELPVGVAGLLIAAIFAATMSTVSTNINSMATAFTVDIYSRLTAHTGDKAQLLTARLAGVVLGALGIGIALLMATWNIRSLYDYFQYVLGLLSSGLGGLFLIGIFFPSIGTRSALMGFVGGALILYLVSTYTDVSGLMYGFIGLAATLLVALGAAIFQKEAPKDLEGLTVKTMKS